MPETDKSCQRIQANCRPKANDFRLITFLTLLCALGFFRSVYPQDIGDVVLGLQRRNASANTISGNFQQNYNAPGIHQTESGKFWLKKPGLMRWEYNHPEKKLFVADGREAFSYVPQEGQVTVQPFTTAEMHQTPLELLLGGGNIEMGFAATWANEFNAKSDGTFLIRLTPRRNEAEYSFLVLELDQATYNVERIVIHEPSGNTSEFLFTNQLYNVEVDDKMFKFEIPEGVEVMRLEDSE